MIRAVNVRQLRYFLQIAELRSFTRASMVLHVAQPALSRQIRQLEEEFETPLFHRSERGVTLTDAGRLLRDRAADILRRLDGLRDEIGSQASTPVGEVTIGMPPSMRELVTVPLIAAARLRYPGLTLHVQEGISMALAEQARGGGLDYVVISDSEPLAHLEGRPLLAESMFLVGPPDAKLDAARSVSLKRVSKVSLALTSRPNSLRLIIEEALAREGLSIDLVVDTNSTTAMLDLIEAGVAWSVLPFCAVATRWRQKRLSIAPVRGLTVRWTIAHARERGLTHAADRLIALTEELTRAAVLAGHWRSAALQR